MILELFSENTALYRESRLVLSLKVDRRNTIYQLTNVSCREGFLYRPFLRAHWLDGSRPASLVGIAALFPRKRAQEWAFRRQKTTRPLNFCCQKSCIRWFLGLKLGTKKYGSPFAYHPAQDQV